MNIYEVVPSIKIVPDAINGTNDYKPAWLNSPKLNYMFPLNSKDLKDIMWNEEPDLLLSVLFLINYLEDTFT